MKEPEEFTEFCAGQVKRLSQFKEYGFIEPAALRDYRRWLERKCGSREHVECVMDAAVLLDQMPTIANLSAIHADLFGTAFTEPEISLEERQARAVYLRDWYALEAAEAEKRREAAKQRKEGRGSVDGCRGGEGEYQRGVE